MRKNIKMITRQLTVMILLAGLWIPARAQKGACWANFRGDSRLSGVSEASLPSGPALLWNFNTQDGIKAAPVFCDGVLVVGTLDGYLYGINENGTLKWKIFTEYGIEAPALIVDGTVYVGNLYGKVFAVDLKSGAIRWTYETDGQIMGSPSFYEKGNKRVILVGSYDYYLHGIDQATGKNLWKYETNNFINGACALYSGMAVFGGCDGEIHMVDALTGKERYSLAISTYVASSAGIDGDRAYVGDYDGYFMAVDLLGHKVDWEFDGVQSNQPFIGSPAIEGNYIYIGNRDRNLYCLNKKDGKEVWKYNTGGQVDASPVIAGNQLLVANMRGDLFLLDKRSGKPGWTYELGTPVYANPAVVNGRFYVAGEDGRVYCFGTK